MDVTCDFLDFFVEGRADGGFSFGCGGHGSVGEREEGGGGFDGEEGAS